MSHISVIVAGWTRKPRCEAGQKPCHAQHPQRILDEGIETWRSTRSRKSCAPP
jgi:hypothetical protein